MEGDSMSTTIKIADGDNDEERELSLEEQINELLIRAKDAQDQCGWAGPTQRDGQMQLAAGATNLGRVTVETLMLLRSIVREG